MPSWEEDRTPEGLGRSEDFFLLHAHKKHRGRACYVHATPQFSGGLWQVMSVTEKSIKADALVLMRNGHLYEFMHKFHDLPLSDTDFKELE